MEYILDSITVGLAYHDEPSEVIALLEQTASVTDGVIADPRPFVTVKEFAAQYIEYELFFFLDLNLGKRGYNEISNEVMINCWRALRDAGMTFSTDVSSAIDIMSAPDFKLEVLTAQTRVTGEST